jgi:hypothetical protein
MLLSNFILHEDSLMGYFYLSHFILQSINYINEVPPIFIPISMLIKNDKLTIKLDLNLGADHRSNVVNVGSPYLILRV